MIEDDVIRGVRAAREEYARLHHFNIRAMVADLQARNAADDWPVVSRPARRPRRTDSSNQAPEPPEVAAPVSESSKVAEAVPTAEL